MLLLLLLRRRLLMMKEVEGSISAKYLHETAGVTFFERTSVSVFMQPISSVFACSSSRMCPTDLTSRAASY